MMKSSFEDRKDLFKGLSIEQDGNNFCLLDKSMVTSNSEKWLKFPVIHLNFVGIGNSKRSKNLSAYKSYCLRRICDEI